jgi:alcohol dehydrogenase class IV
VLASPLGRRAIVVSGSRTNEANGVIDEAEASLRAAGIEVTTFRVASHEPEVNDVDELTRSVRALNPTPDDFVAAIGGGSTIDLAKAVAALATNRHGESVVDFLEGVGRGLKITTPPLSLVAMPTTAGTGAEATKNAVISSNSGDSTSAPYKKSLRSDLMIPRLVLVDPELTVTLPPLTTGDTGMDAITQLIESYISRRASPIPQALCLQGLKYAIPGLPLAVKNPDLREAREAMSHAALLSGIALANSGLGMAHGVAAALGITCGLPHGRGCAIMLPMALRANRVVSRARLAELERLFDSSAASDEAACDAFISRIERLCRELNIPEWLGDAGVKHEQIEALVAGSRGNSMSANPRDIEDTELREILEKNW